MNDPYEVQSSLTVNVELVILKLVSRINLFKMPQNLPDDRIDIS